MKNSSSVKGTGRTRIVLRLLGMAMIAAATATGVVALQVRAESQLATQQAADQIADEQQALLHTAPGFRELTIVENTFEVKTRLHMEPGVAATVGQALLALGFALDKPDIVYPAADQPVPWFGRIYIQRAPGVVLHFDDTVREIKTGARTVKQLLAEQKVTLDTDDRVEPAGPTPITANMVVRVVRVETKEETETEVLAFDTEVVEDSGLYVGEEAVATAGAEGTKEKKFKVTFEDGKEVSRELVEETIVAEPVTKVVLQGTKARPVERPAESAPAQSGPAIGPFADLINDAAAQYGVSAQELMSVMICESGGNAQAYNPAGPYYGLFQFNEGSYRAGPHATEDLYDPAGQIYNAAYYFSIGRRGMWGC